MCFRNAEISQNDQTNEVVSYLQTVAKNQDGMINPQNLRAPDCPPI